MTQTNKVAAAAKKDLANSWNKCRIAEKHCVDFGHKCYDWQQKLQEVGVNICKIWKELKIPRQTAWRWIQIHLEVEGLKPARPDRAKTNADIVNAVTSRLENVRSAISRIETDWAGWATTCPKETTALASAIKTAGYYLVSLEKKIKGAQ